MPYLTKPIKIFWWVLLAHILGLGVLLFFSSAGRKKFFTGEVSTVDLVEPVELALAAPEEPLPPEPEPEVQPPPEEKAEPAPPKKITKRVEILTLPPSELKKRLKKRLSQVETKPAPERDKTTAPPGRTTVMKTRGFPYSWYNNYVKSKIEGLWKIPSKAAVGKDIANPLVAFRVYRDGHIESVRLTKSSGSRIMDQSALQAVRAADPLPPLPEGFKRLYQELELEFEPKEHLL